MVVKCWEINASMERRCRVSRGADLTQLASLPQAVLSHFFLFFCKNGQLQQFKAGAESTKTVSLLQSHKMSNKKMVSYQTAMF